MLQNEKREGRESEPAVANRKTTTVTTANKALVDSNNRRHEPAKRFQSNRFRQKRNFMFVAWSAIFLYFSIASEFQNRAVALPSQTSFAPDDLLSPLPRDGVQGKYATAAHPSSSVTPGFYSGKNELSLGGEDEKNNSISETARAGAPQYKEVPGFNCTPPGIDDFPQDLFTEEERRQGYVIIHFLVSFYIFYALAIVCDDYFVPSMECICEGLKMPTDVAGATFMAIATSAPELFTNIIGTFITKGDIGIGTIVGSAVFNILAVAAVCGIGAGMVVPLEWWSVTRDCLCYSISVILLIIVLRDEKIYWYEALVLVLIYAFYILAMYKNSALKRGAERLVFAVDRKLKGGKTETTYTMKEAVNGNGTKLDIEDAENKDENLIENAVKNMQAEAAAEKEQAALFKPPIGQGCIAMLKWIVSWPIDFVYRFTIPDCREEKWRRFYPLTFFMCVVWIGVLAYLVNWMMTIIGHTLKIPDSIMGITAIAAGTSVPECVSSIIVARQGLGSMALSNSIGSNTFDILMCLGLPWLIRASMIANDSTNHNFIQINSTGLEYSTIMLITSLAVLYTILAVNKFVLDKRVGFTALALYGCFLVMASLFELNVFFPVNMPPCIFHED